MTLQRTDHGVYLDLERLPDGNLKLQLTDTARSEFADFECFRDEHGIHAALLELLADHLGNSWEEIRPEEINALTSSLLLSEEVKRDEHGVLIEVGRVYWNPQYAVMDEIEELRIRSFMVMNGVE